MTDFKPGGRVRRKLLNRVAVQGGRTGIVGSVLSPKSISVFFPTGVAFLTASDIEASPAPTTAIGAGWGYEAGQNFARAQNPVPIELEPSIGPSVYGWIAPNPQSSLSFLRGPGMIRVKVLRRAITEMAS